VAPQTGSEHGKQQPQRHGHVQPHHHRRASHWQAYRSAVPQVRLPAQDMGEDEPHPAGSEGAHPDPYRPSRRDQRPDPRGHQGQAHGQGHSATASVPPREVPG